MAKQLAFIPPLPSGGVGFPPEINGAIVDTKIPAGNQLDAESVQIRAMTLTSAQLLALKTTDVSIVTAPGAGYAIALKSVSMRVNYVTAYTLNAGTLKIFLGPSATGIALTGDLATLLTQTATSDNVGVPALASGVQTQANSENQGLVVGNTGTANYTGGTSTLDVIVTYVIVQM